MICQSRAMQEGFSEVSNQIERQKALGGTENLEADQERRRIVNNRQCRIRRSKRNPWEKTFHSIESRCNDRKRRYFLNGIKKKITKEELKFIWFRDRAYEMIQPSIDRINPDDHYYLNNCRYIEMSENRKNTRVGLRKFNGNILNFHKNRTGAGP